MLAPIVLFVYNRPEHTLKTLEALAKNDLANESNLIVFADGPKVDASEEVIKRINETRDIVLSKQWCKTVELIASDRNKGLAESIIYGVTEIVNKYGKIVVLEDDIVTSRGFLLYMNQALELYAKEERVMQISAYMHPVKVVLPETLFYNVNSCWGWGTWSNSWRNFKNDPAFLLDELNKNYDSIRYNGGQGEAFYKQLLDNSTGALNTWAVKWHTSIYLKNGFVLHPGKSLSRNIGHDSSGVNCGNSPTHTHQEISDFVKVQSIPIKENKEIVIAFLKKNSTENYRNFFSSFNTNSSNIIKLLKRAYCNQKQLFIRNINEKFSKKTNKY